jgi:hypothetical protein
MGILSMNLVKLPVMTGDVLDVMRIYGVQGTAAALPRLS